MSESLTPSYALRNGGGGGGGGGCVAYYSIHVFNSLFLYCYNAGFFIEGH